MKFPFSRPRSRRPGIGGKRTDAQFPGLDRRRADELRRELQEGFVGHGFDVELSGMTLVLSRETPEDKIVLPLDDLVRGIAADDAPHAVAAWTDSFIKATLAVDIAANLDTSGVYRSLRLVLMPAQPGGPGDHEGAAYPEQEEEIRVIEDASIGHFTADLLTCLVLDMGAAATPARMEELAQIDDVDTLVRAARRNLRDELRSLEVEVAYQNIDDEVEGAGVWVIRGNSFYLSAAPLLLEDFVHRHVPQVNAEAGLLFAVPLPNFLLVREVTEGEDLAHGLHMMASGAVSLAAGAGADAAVSPRVHLWREGHVETISEITDGDGFLIQPNSYLMRRLEGR